MQKTLLLDNIYAFKQFLSGKVYIIREENDFQLNGNYEVTSKHANPNESLFGSVTQVIKIKLTAYDSQLVTVPRNVLDPYVIDSGFSGCSIDWLDDVKGYDYQIPQSTVHQVNAKTFDLLLVKRI